MYVLPHRVRPNINKLFNNCLNKTNTCNGMIFAITFYYSIHTA